MNQFYCTINYSNYLLLALKKAEEMAVYQCEGRIPQPSVLHVDESTRISAFPAGVYLCVNGLKLTCVVKHFDWFLRAKKTFKCDQTMFSWAN